MITYWVFYFLLSTMAIFYKDTNQKIFWFAIGIILSVFIGFRHEIGGDWPSYIRHYNEMQYYDYVSIFTRGDPGYYLINLFAYNNDLTIYFVNFLVAIIFCTGLIMFARKQFNPWLVLAVAFPYLIIVVSMGYTRQAGAIGLILMGISLLDTKKGFYYLILFVFLAALFHKSAVLVLGLVMFSKDGSRLFKFIALSIIGFGMYNAFLVDFQDRLIANYIEAQYESSGAMIRVIMNALPGLLLLIFRNEWKKYYEDYNFWKILALISIISILLVNFSSTAVDRVALYIIMIQLVVFARLPLLLKNHLSISTTTILIFLYYALIQFVWLNFASHAPAWIPYQNILLYDLW